MTSTRSLFDKAAAGWYLWLIELGLPADELADAEEFKRAVPLIAEVIEAASEITTHHGLSRALAALEATDAD